MTNLNRSVQRSMKIVEVVADNGVCSLSRLADETGLPKPTVLRICATLMSQRWLSQNRNDKRYRLGPRFPRMGPARNLVDALIEAGKTEIVLLSQATGLAVDLAASIGNGHVEIVDTTRVFSTHGIFPDSIGYRPSPARSALGCAYLSALAPKQLAAYSKAWSELATGRDQDAALNLLQKIHRIRKDGFATREDGYWGRAVDYGDIPRAIGVVVQDDNNPIGAISLVWRAEQHSVCDVVRAHLPRLQSAAAEIGRRLQLDGQGACPSRQ